MKYSHTTIVVVLSGLFLTANQVHSAPFKPMSPHRPAAATNYVGASMGMSRSDDLCKNYAQCDDGDKSWKAYSGVRLNESIVMEGGYIQFGEVSFKDSAGNTATSQLSGYTAAGLATYPYSDQIELFGKAGMLWWENEFSSTTNHNKQSGSNTFVGVGANYDMGDNIGIRAEWERFESLQRTDNEQQHAMDMLSLGVTFSSL